MRQILEAAARGIDDAVEARALFQPNAKTTVAFDGEILGRFVRNGPNPWDTYRFVPEAGEGIRVFPGINVQLAAQGPVFRMRAKGSVLSVAWVPAQDFGRPMPPPHAAHFLKTA